MSCGTSEAELATEFRVLVWDEHKDQLTFELGPDGTLFGLMLSVGKRDAWVTNSAANQDVFGRLYNILVRTAKARCGEDAICGRMYCVHIGDDIAYFFVPVKRRREFSQGMCRVISDNSHVRQIAEETARKRGITKTKRLVAPVEGSAARKRASHTGILLAVVDEGIDDPNYTDGNKLQRDFWLQLGFSPETGHPLRSMPWHHENNLVGVHGGFDIRCMLRLCKDPVFDLPADQEEELRNGVNMTSYGDIVNPTLDGLYPTTRVLNNWFVGRDPAGNMLVRVPLGPDGKPLTVYSCEIGQASYATLLSSFAPPYAHLNRPKVEESVRNYLATKWPGQDRDPWEHLRAGEKFTMKAVGANMMLTDLEKYEPIYRKRVEAVIEENQRQFKAARQRDEEALAASTVLGERYAEKLYLEASLEGLKKENKVYQRLKSRGFAHLPNTHGCATPDDARTGPDARIAMIERRLKELWKSDDEELIGKLDYENKKQLQEEAVALLTGDTRPEFSHLFNAPEDGIELPTSAATRDTDEGLDLRLSELDLDEAYCSMDSLTTELGGSAQEDATAEHINAVPVPPSCNANVDKKLFDTRLAAVMRLCTTSVQSNSDIPNAVRACVKHSVDTIDDVQATLGRMEGLCERALVMQDLLTKLEMLQDISTTTTELLMVLVASRNATRASRAGTSVLLAGPPGTGKSNAAVKIEALSIVETCKKITVLSQGTMRGGFAHQSAWVYMDELCATATGETEKARGAQDGTMGEQQALMKQLISEDGYVVIKSIPDGDGGYQRAAFVTMGRMVLVASTNNQERIPTSFLDRMTMAVVGEREARSGREAMVLMSQNTKPMNRKQKKAFKRACLNHQGLIGTLHALQRMGVYTDADLTIATRVELEFLRKMEDSGSPIPKQKRDQKRVLEAARELALIIAAILSQQPKHKKKLREEADHRLQNDYTRMGMTTAEKERMRKMILLTCTMDWIRRHAVVDEYMVHSALMLYYGETFRDRSVEVYKRAVWESGCLNPASLHMEQVTVTPSEPVHPSSTAMVPAHPTPPVNDTGAAAAEGTGSNTCDPGAAFTAVLGAAPSEGNPATSIQEGAPPLSSMPRHQWAENAPAVTEGASPMNRNTSRRSKEQRRRDLEVLRAQASQFERPVGFSIPWAHTNPTRLKEYMPGWQGTDEMKLARNRLRRHVLGTTHHTWMYSSSETDRDKKGRDRVVVPFHTVLLDGIPSPELKMVIGSLRRTSVLVVDTPLTTSVAKLCKAAGFKQSDIQGRRLVTVLRSLSVVPAYYGGHYKHPKDAEPFEHDTLVHMPCPEGGMPTECVLHPVLFRIVQLDPQSKQAVSVMQQQQTKHMPRVLRVLPAMERTVDKYPIACLLDGNGTRDFTAPSSADLDRNMAIATGLYGYCDTEPLRVTSTIFEYSMIDRDGFLPTRTSDISLAPYDILDTSAYGPTTVSAFRALMGVYESRITDVPQATLFDDSMELLKDMDACDLDEEAPEPSAPDGMDTTDTDKGAPAAEPPVDKATDDLLREVASKVTKDFSKIKWSSRKRKKTDDHEGGEKRRALASIPEDDEDEIRPAPAPTTPKRGLAAYTISKHRERSTAGAQRHFAQFANSE